MYAYIPAGYFGRLELQTGTNPLHLYTNKISTCNGIVLRSCDGTRISFGHITYQSVATATDRPPLLSKDILDEAKWIQEKGGLEITLLYRPEVGTKTLHALENILREYATTRCELATETQGISISLTSSPWQFHKEDPKEVVYHPLEPWLSLHLQAQHRVMLDKPFKPTTLLFYGSWLKLPVEENIIGHYRSVPCEDKPIATAVVSIFEHLASATLPIEDSQDHENFKQLLAFLSLLRHFSNEESVPLSTAMTAQLKSLKQIIASPHTFASVFTETSAGTPVIDALQGKTV